MKRISIGHHDNVCFIQQEDIKILVRMGDFLGIDITSEASITSGECDENGFYRIERPENVRAICSFNFIPDYDKFSNLSLDILRRMTKQSQRDYMVLCELINRIFDKKQPVDQESAIFLKDLGVIDLVTFYKMVDDFFNATDKQELHFREGSLFFKEQMYHYAASIRTLTKMLEEEQQSKDMKTQGNVPFVKKLFLKMKKGCNAP